MQRILSKLCKFLPLLLAGIFLLGSSPGWAQERVVTGRVTSQDDGQGFPGVNIVVKGTTVGTVTDSDGKFSLSVPSSESTLVFSSIGYAISEVVVGSQTNIEVALLTDITSLAEVVVVGYGTTKKSDVTGALTSVSADQLRSVPVQSISQGLQGRASGVDITQTSTRPGDNPVIRIRGNRSLLGGNDPLIVLDGIPLPEGSSVNDFNPNDVQSIEILKDASAAAIYGSRGANGVILVTTKKGKVGVGKITYDGFYGVSSPLANVDMKTGGQHAEMRREAYRNNGGLAYPLPWADVALDYAQFSPQDIEVWNSVADGYEWVDRNARIPVTRPVTDAEREVYEQYYDQYQLRYPVASAARTPAVDAKIVALRALLDDPNLEIPVYNSKNVRNTDWGDLALQTGRKQSHQFSVSGGTEGVRVFFGAGYYGEEGIQKTQAFQRFNAKFGIDYKANDWLSVGGTMTGTVSVQEYGSPLYFRAIGQVPLAIPYDANGNIILQPGGDALIFSPLNEIEDYVDDRRTSRFFGSYYAEAKIIEGLRYRVNIGTDFRHYRRGQYQGALTSDRRGGTSWGNYDQNQRFSYVVDNLLYYEKEFNEVHNIGATALFGIQRDRFEGSAINVSNLPYDTQLFYNLGSTNASGPDGFSSDYSLKSIMYFMGRINYSFKDRYLLTVTGRRDGLSSVAPENRWGFFPSASLAWKIHQESFMSGIGVVDELKLRLGYGEVGNSNVPQTYVVDGRLQKVPYVWGETPAWGYVGQLTPNPAMSWEGTQSMNIGLDFGILQSRITGTLELYQQNTDGLIMNRQVPTVSGYGGALENIGKVSNKGIELMLNTINIDMSNGLKWTTNIVFSKNKEELVELYGGTNDDLGSRWFIGQPITTYYDWQPIGVWQVSEAEEAKLYSRIPGQGKIKDQPTVDTNNDGKLEPDGVINAADMVIRGNNVPKWTGSMVNTVSFKGFDFSFMLFARQGSTIASGFHRPALAGRYPEPAFIDYWTPANPTNAYPRPTADQERIDYPEAYLYQDGSFVKMRNITLSYNFSESMISKFKMSNLRVYVTAFNPFLWTKFEAGDPEFYANATRNNGGLNTQITSVNDQLIGNNLSDKSVVFGLTVGF